MNKVLLSSAIIALTVSAPAAALDGPNRTPDWVRIPAITQGVASTQCVNTNQPEEVSITLALTEIARQLELHASVLENNSEATPAKAPYSASKTLTRQVLGSLVTVAAMDKSYIEAHNTEQEKMSFESVARVYYGAEKIRAVSSYQAMTEDSKTAHYSSRFNIENDTATWPEIKYLLVKSPNFILRTELVEVTSEKEELCSYVGYPSE